MSLAPDYARPPVAETVLGLEFSMEPPLRTHEIVESRSLWIDEFPELVEQPELPPTRPISQAGQLDFQLTMGHPALRIWMLAPDQHQLLQLQKDRLVLNWRKLDGDAAYPKFDALFEAYEIYLGRFTERFADRTIAPLVSEWTYLNSIPEADLQGARLFETWNDPELQGIGGSPVSSKFQHVRDIATEDGVRGQVEISAERTSIDGKFGVGLRISAKYFGPHGDSIDNALARCRAAHDVARAAIEATTTPEAQQKWGRGEA
jgi:uncharacterized protein (TIGR04255 family)